MRCGALCRSSACGGGRHGHTHFCEYAVRGVGMRGLGSQAALSVALAHDGTDVLGKLCQLQCFANLYLCQGLGLNDEC